MVLDCNHAPYITRQSNDTWQPATPNFWCIMKTFTATPADIEKTWILIDAEGVVLGR
ncbi:MAG: hypothetical protein ACJAVT_002814, partial [Yoonia sp.]